MYEAFTNKNIQKILLDLLDEITEILKASAHARRLQVLLLLLDKSRNFAYLLKKTGVSRTTLSNHLSILIDSSLINRKERGNYELTIYASKFLKGIAWGFSKSQYKHKIEIQRIIKNHAKLFGVRKEIYKGNRYGLIDKKKPYKQEWCVVNTLNDFEFDGEKYWINDVPQYDVGEDNQCEQDRILVLEQDNNRYYFDMNIDRIDNKHIYGLQKI